MPFIRHPGGLRTAALSLALALTAPLAAPATAQYDPLAPRPSARLRGAVVACGGATDATCLAQFVRLADAGARLTVVDPGRTLDVDWAALGARDVDTVTDLERVPGLADARAVWLELPDDPYELARVSGLAPAVA